MSAAQASSAAIPPGLQPAAKKLAVEKGTEGFSRCVVVFHFPGDSLNAEALRTMMGVIGTVKDCRVGRRGARFLACFRAFPASGGS